MWTRTRTTNGTTYTSARALVRKTWWTAPGTNDPRFGWGVFVDGVQQGPAHRTAREAMATADRQHAADNRADAATKQLAQARRWKFMTGLYKNEWRLTDPRIETRTAEQFAMDSEHALALTQCMAMGIRIRTVEDVARETAAALIPADAVPDPECTTWRV